MPNTSEAFYAADDYNALIMGRSVLAIVLGFVASAAIVMGIHTSLENFNPSITLNFGGQLILLAGDAFAGAIGGLVAASIAKRHRRRHAIILALIVAALAALMTIRPDPGVPTWYAWGLPVISFVAIVAGGRLRSKT